MRVAIYQCEPRPGDVAGNLERLARVAAEAAAENADLLLTPEMFLTGYNIGRYAARELAEPRDGASARAVAEIARANRVAILYGYPELGGGDDEAQEGDRPGGDPGLSPVASAVFNSVQLIGADGIRLGNYRKTHLFGDLDRSMFSASATDSPLVDIGGWRVGLLICYDVEFPENTRRLALAGADLILVPTANMVPYDVVATTIVPARAFENQVYVAYANYCGSEGEIEYRGQSVVASPNGVDAARAGRSEELVIGDLDRDMMAASRSINTYVADRRPELYGSLATPLEP